MKGAYPRTTILTATDKGVHDKNTTSNSKIQQKQQHQDPQLPEIAESKTNGTTEQP